MNISRGGFEGGDPLLNDSQWICVYLCGLSRIYMDLHGFRWISMHLGVQVPEGLPAEDTEARIFCQRKTRRSCPYKKELLDLGGLEARSWKPGGLEAWKLDLGSLQACLGGKPGSMLRRQAWWRHAGKHVSRTSNTLDAQRGRRINKDHRKPICVSVVFV